MKKQGLKIRAALFLVTAALASSPSTDLGGGSDEKGCKQRQG